MKPEDIKFGKLYWASHSCDVWKVRVIGGGPDVFVCRSFLMRTTWLPGELIGPVYRPRGFFGKLWAKITGTWDQMEPLP